MKLFKSFHTRVGVVRRTKPNLILVVVGLTLLILAPCWRFIIAPAMRVVPTDFDLFRQFSGIITVFANPPGEPVVGGTPMEIPVLIERVILSRPDLSTSGISSVDVDTVVMDHNTGETLYESDQALSIDKKTGELSGVDSESDASGHLILFPFDTPEGVVPVWFEPAAESFDAQYIGHKTEEGLDLLEFKLELSGEAIQTPSGYPDQYTGAELKESLSMPELGIADTAVCPAVYQANASFSFLVEPVMGTIVGLNGGELDLLLTATQSESEFKITKLVRKLNLSSTSFSVTESLTYAKDELSKWKLQYTYIPIFYLALGTVLLIIGLFVGTKEKKEKEESAVEENEEEQDQSDN